MSFSKRNVVDYNKMLDESKKLHIEQQYGEYCIVRYKSDQLYLCHIEQKQYLSKISGVLIGDVQEVPVFLAKVINNVILPISWEDESEIKKKYFIDTCYLFDNNICHKIHASILQDAGFDISHIPA